MLGLKNIMRKITGPSPSCAILMYHHVQSNRIDPWETCVSIDHFKAQLNILKEDYEVLSLSEFSHAFSRRKEKRKRVFITFDDGYLDNYEIAVPELQKQGFPATFFIPTQPFNGAAYFWWEILDHFFWVNEQSPAEIVLSCENHSFAKSLSAAMLKRNLQAEYEWSANSELPPTARCQLYLELCNWIKERSPKDQQAIADQLMALCTSKQMAGDQKMSTYQIKQLSMNGFEIGAHTVHHPALGLQTYEVQQYEIRKCKSDLEALIGKKVDAIAYPHGHFNRDTIALTKKTGYRLACTTETGLVNNRADPFALPRIWVKNIDGFSFRQKLSDLFKD